MRKIPRTCLATEDLAVIAYHEDNGDLVVLRFSHGQERDIRFAFRCIADYDPACIMLHRKPHLICCLIQSFAKDENISPEQAHQIAYQLAEALPEWADFEVLIATHTDTEYLHTHFIVNSVSYVDGHKLQQSRDELQNMKDQSDRLYHEMMVNQ